MTADNVTLWNSLPDWNLGQFDQFDLAANRLTNNTFANNLISNVCESKNLIIALLVIVVMQFFILVSFILWYVFLYSRPLKRKIAERIVETAAEDADL